MPGSSSRLRTGAFLALFLCCASMGFCLDGHMAFGVGPVNESMGGAGTACFLDSLGTITWNPAGSVRFEGLHIDIGGEIFVPKLRVESTLEAKAVNDIFPAVTLSGETSSRPTTVVQPAFGITYKPSEESRWALHTGAIPLAVASVDFPEEPVSGPNTNVIFSRQFPYGLGLGRLETDYALITVPTGASFSLTDNLQIGFSAMPSISWLKVSPAAFVDSDDANGDGFPSYPVGEDLSYKVGFGGQLGVAWSPLENLTLGASMSTPIWFNDHKFKLKDEAGGRRHGTINVDAPPILSTGIAWEPFAGTTLAADARVIFFREVAPFGEDADYTPGGGLIGFGWKNSPAIGIGVQQELGERLSLRLGYHWIDSPTSEENAFFQLAAPLVTEHHIAAGFSVLMKEGATFNFAFTHAFERSISGPLVFPPGNGLAEGVIPRSNIQQSLSVTTFQLGFSFDL